MSGDTTTPFFEELRNKKIKPGDKFYIVNDKTKCAIYMSEQRQDYYTYGKKRVAKGTSLNVGHLFSFDLNNQRYTQKDKNKKNITGIRFKYSGDTKDPHSNEYYMGFAENKKYNHVYFLGNTPEGHKQAAYIRLYTNKNDTVGTTTPKYFTPYIIRNIFEPNSVIGYKESTSELWTTEVDPDTTSWIFVPSNTPSGISPLCYYQEYFSQTLNYDPQTGRYSETGNYPKCANPREIVNTCSKQLNDYCSSGDNAFGKNNCYRWFKDNYLGIADSAITKVCSRKENADKRQCGCIAPIQNITQENVNKDRLMLDYTCYGVKCQNNDNAWLTKNQYEQRKCPDTLCTIHDVDIKSGRGVEFSQNCSKSVKENVFNNEPQKPSTSNPDIPVEDDDDEEETPPEEKKSKLWLYLLIGGVAVIGVILLFYFITKKNNKENVQQPQYYDPRYGYYK